MPDPTDPTDPTAIHSADPTDSIRRVIDETKRVVGRVRADQLADATPCTDWDVRALLNHIAGGATMFAECVEHGAIADAELGRLMTDDLVGDDHIAAFATAADRAVAAFDAPGALDKVVTLPFGQMPASIALQIAVFDVTVHALDLIEATGQPNDIDPDVVETAWQTAQSMLSDDMRAAGLFGPVHECAPDATRSQQLLAYAGRKL